MDHKITRKVEQPIAIIIQPKINKKDLVTAVAQEWTRLKQI